jgi:tetratricopeptide (TPR) repeat protein
MANRASHGDHFRNSNAADVIGAMSGERRSSQGGKRTVATEDALQRARIALEQRRPDEAARIALALLAKAPHEPRALHILGLGLLLQGRPAEAVRPLEEAARTLADPVIETHVAVALRQIGQTPDALTWLQRATARQPVFPLAFHELGVLLFSQRRLEEAETVVRRGLDAAPATAELLVLLGGILLDRGDRPSAKAAFARAVANAPQHPGALYGLGAALMDDGEFARAAERYRQALARDPTYLQARVSLGSCLLELGQRDEALSHLRAVAAASPHFYGKAMRALATSARGQFWLKPSVAAAFLKSGDRS